MSGSELIVGDIWSLPLFSIRFLSINNVLQITYKSFWKLLSHLTSAYNSNSEDYNSSTIYGWSQSLGQSIGDVYGTLFGWHLINCIHVYNWPLHRWGWRGQCWCWWWSRWGSGPGWTWGIQTGDNLDWGGLVLNFTVIIFSHLPRMGITMSPLEEPSTPWRRPSSHLLTWVGRSPPG